MKNAHHSLVHHKTFVHHTTSEKYLEKEMMKKRRRSSHGQQTKYMWVNRKYISHFTLFYDIKFLQNHQKYRFELLKRYSDIQDFGLSNDLGYLLITN